MKRFLMLLALAAAVGCGAKTETPTTPAEVPQPAETPVPATSAVAPPGQSEPEPVAQTPEAQESGSIVGRTTRDVLDAKQATADPNWVVITPEVSGSDPFTVAGTAYNRAATFAGSLGIQQWIDQQKALEGKPPTFAELQAFLKQNPRLEFPAVKDYQSYGYDETTGAFVVLENKAEKAAKFKELGLPAPE